MCARVKGCDEYRDDRELNCFCTVAGLPDVRTAATGEVLNVTVSGWLQILFFFVVILAITKPLGVFMAHVFKRERTFVDPVLRPIERAIYKLTRVDETRDMRCTEYAVTMLLFGGVSMLWLYLVQPAQAPLPFNPQQLPGVDAK